MNNYNLEEKDTEISEIIKAEEKRRQETLEMIPSENHTSRAVLEAMSSILSDKYAEGYPGKRYYGGNVHIDQIEVLCQERTKKAFKVEHANVQPYSGSPANMAVYMACLDVGDKVMGMDLKSGGHLTHGWKVSFSGIYYNSCFYGVDPETEVIDYQEVEKIANEEKPKLIWVGGSAYSREFNWKNFQKIADSVGAYLVADIAHIAGLVVSGVHSSPSEYVDIITTTTHKTLRGPRGGLVMVTENGLKKDKDLAKKIDKAVFPGLQGGPHENQIAAKAVCLKEAMESSFKSYSEKVVENSKHLAQLLTEKGFRIVTGGTDNHLFLVDLRPKNIDGSRAQLLLEEAGITVNKNAIPYDSAPPMRPSGIRIGTPAVTTRGFGLPEIELVAEVIDKVISANDEDEAKKQKIIITQLAKKFPLF